MFSLINFSIVCEIVLYNRFSIINFFSPNMLIVLRLSTRTVGFSLSSSPSIVETKKGLFSSIFRNLIVSRKSKLTNPLLVP